jgi:hypothetical protein
LAQRSSAGEVFANVIGVAGFRLAFSVVARCVAKSKKTGDEFLKPRAPRNG